MPDAFKLLLLIAFCSEENNSPFSSIAFRLVVSWTECITSMERRLRRKSRFFQSIAAALVFDGIYCAQLLELVSVSLCV